MYEIVKHYRDDPALRASFNALAEKTFGLNFEGWYQNGFWQDNYEPYSVVLEGRVVANVSVNRTDLVIRGERKKVLQLGTVMTDEAHRNQGMIRAIMERIGKDYPDVDGIYLFANDSVVDFIPSSASARVGSTCIPSRSPSPDPGRRYACPWPTPGTGRCCRRPWTRTGSARPATWWTIPG